MGGVSAVIVCGTTGEAATLSAAEHETLFRRAADRCGGKMKFIAGIGSNDTRKALDMAAVASDCGADGVLMVVPYYNKTTQAGLIEHFTYVADRSPVPVILYNIPSRAGIGIDPETYAVLAEHPNINGAKEASGNISAFARTKALCGDRLYFWSGNDSDTVPMMALGAKGVISVASNLVPDGISRICDECLAGNYSAAAALNEHYAELFSLLFCEVNPIPVKAALSLMGLCSGELRLPLIPMSGEHLNNLRSCLTSLELLS